MADINLKFYHHIPPGIYIVPHPDSYDISASVARLRISKNDFGGVIWDSQNNGGVFIEQINLSKTIEYPNGEFLDKGESVFAISVKPTTNYIDLLTQVTKNVYQYSLSVDEENTGGWSIQGLWEILPETGPSNRSASTEQIGVIKSVEYIAVAVSGGQGPAGPKGDTGEQGPKGDTGEPGGDLAIATITETTQLEPVNQFIVVAADGNDISITFPSPASMFDIANGTTKEIKFHRKKNDLGDVDLLGDSSSLPDVLYSDESGSCISDGSNLIIRW